MKRRDGELSAWTSGGKGTGRIRPDITTSLPSGEDNIGGGGRGGSSGAIIICPEQVLRYQRVQNMEV